MQVTGSSEKAYRGLAMEGSVARRYDRVRRSGRQIEESRRAAVQLTEGLADGGRILEVAPGPGYFAIEMARLGRFRVTGLDISHTFVEIARANAQKDDVNVDFREGDVSRMPFVERSFDLIVCQAAFKNFSRPLDAINEMHRVLRPEGTAVIQDLRKDAPNVGIQKEVAAMELGWLDSLMTRWILRRLRRRACSVQQFEALARRSAFGKCKATTGGIGVEVRLTRSGVAVSAG